MSSNSLVSVIIPCYNTSKYVEQAIRSIMNQTYKNLEIIVTDDYSTDDTLEILQNLAKEDSRIRLYKNERNLKIIKTLNQMVQKSNGEYIARMDADDISAPDRIEKQLEYLQKHKEIDVCGTNAVIIDENNNKIGKSILPSSFDEVVFYSKYFCPVYHPTILGKSWVFKENPYSEDFVHIEDYELWVRLLFLKNVKISNIEEKLFFYRKSKSQISSENSLFQLKSTEKIYKKYLKKEDCIENSEYKRVILLEGLECSSQDFKYIRNLIKIAPISRAKIVLIQRLLAFLWKTKSFFKLFILCFNPECFFSLLVLVRKK